MYAAVAMFTKEMVRAPSAGQEEVKNDKEKTKPQGHKLIPWGKCHYLARCCEGYPRLLIFHLLANSTIDWCAINFHLG